MHTHSRDVQCTCAQIAYGHYMVNNTTQIQPPPVSGCVSVCARACVSEKTHLANVYLCV